MEMSETDVLIVGAGPTGLSLACQLARHGVDFVVVEKKEGVTPYSKAIGVQARTLEIYEQMGLAGAAVERGEVAGKLRLLAGGKVRGEMRLADFGRDFSAYPFMLLLEQSKNEELLYEYLRGRGREVCWQTELESFSQDDAGVEARVTSADGGARAIRAKYLVGCDGAGSFVRRSLGLTFEGSTFERLFYVAGDAAHIHSPVGAQGMNTGIQDAYNLAWKLALAVQGHAGGRLLDTYHEERSANAKRLLETTDRFFELGVGAGPLVSFIRTTIFPPVAGFVAGLRAVRKRFFPLISQTGINYRDSSLSRHATDGQFKVKAGDRMPYLLIGGRNVYDSLREPKFHLLTFSDERVEPRSEAAHLTDYHHFPLDARVKEAFGTDEPFSVLLRPDNHVALVTPQATPPGGVTLSWLAKVNNS